MAAMHHSFSMKAHAPGSNNNGSAKWKVARSFPRFGLALSMEISGSRLPAPLSARIIDISLGGICATVQPLTLHAGDRVYLKFRLPMAQEPMTILAKVRYCSDERHGFQFLTITPQQREQIREACRNLVIV